MSKVRVLLAVVTLALVFAVTAQAGGRQRSGGHPYHNGFYAVPPVSAYEAVRVRAPIRYGAPMYYFPDSYLPPAFAGQFPATYPGTPAARAGYYFMSVYSQSTVYPW